MGWNLGKLNGIYVPNTLKRRIRHAREYHKVKSQTRKKKSSKGLEPIYSNVARNRHWFQLNTCRNTE